MFPDHGLAVAGLAAAAVLSPRLGSRAVAGAALSTLGAAALRVALGPAQGTYEPEQLRTLPAFALIIDAVLELAGVFIAAGAAVGAFRAHGPARYAASALAGVAAVILAVPAVRHAGPVMPTALAIAALLAGGLWVLLRSSADPVDTAGPAGVVAAGLTRTAGILIGLATIASLMAADVLVVLLAAVVASMAGFALVRASGVRFAWPLLVSMPALALAGYLIATIAGPTSRSLAVLADGPFSPAAEAMIVPLLAAGTVPLFGVRPLSRGALESLLALVGAGVLLRIGAGVFPGGMLAWETVAIPLGVVFIGLAAYRRDVVAAAAALAWIAAFSGGASGAWWLAGVATAASALRHGAPVPAGRRELHAGLAAAGAFGAATALPFILATETLYGVIAWLLATVTAFRALHPARR